MSIILDPKYGVNPSINVCFYCGEDKEVILFGLIKNDMRKALKCGAEAPKKVCLNKEPCNKCIAFMKQGIIFVGVSSTSTPDNPIPNGMYCVIKDSAVEKLITDEKILNEILQKRMAFIDDELWDKLGFPTENVQYCSGI